VNGAEAVVLVAEDSVVVRALLRAQLAERGYTVVEAGDGHEALAKAAEARPDVILLDVEMPGLDGFGVLERLRSTPGLADIPVVFVSGRTNAEDAVQGLDLGAHDYLRKPFEAGELAARVHAAARTKRLQDELRAMNGDLQRLATTDALTGVPNRRMLDDQLRRHVSRAARHKRPLAVMLIDVDRFKDINDRLGHPSGDQALVGITRRLAQRLRAEDVLGRWGGEEFMVITPDVDGAGAGVLAEALRAEVAGRPLVADGSELAVTVSIGWAGWRGEPAEQLVVRADAALRRAKDGGRNRVEAG
jgi:two-component system, cell cycle response regulator